MTFALTTDVLGASTVSGESAVLGVLVKVEWVVGDFDAGVGAVLSQIKTASGIDETILTLAAANSDACYYPLVAAGTATWNSTAGSDYPILNGTPKVVVSAGGATNTGKLILYWIDID